MTFFPEEFVTNSEEQFPMVPNELKISTQNDRKYHHPHPNANLSKRLENFFFRFFKKKRRKQHRGKVPFSYLSKSFMTALGLFCGCFAITFCILKFLKSSVLKYVPFLYLSWSLYARFMVAFALTFCTLKFFKASEI